MDATLQPGNDARLFSRRSAILQAAALGIGAATVKSAATLAQNDATPAPCAGGVPAGTVVPFVSVEGAEIGTLTIDKVEDPFTGYNPAYPPPRGDRFVLLTLTAKNTGVNPWGVDAGRVFLQDVEGFVIYPSGVDLGPEPPIPAFAYQDVAPGAEVTGVIGYVLIKGVAPKRVFFAPSGDRLVLLAELPDAA